MRARNQPSADAGTHIPRSPDAPAPAASTKAGHWFDAWRRGERLPEHTLPDDTDVLIWTQAMEQRP